MRVVKIKKRYYRDLEFMYKDLGLVTESNGRKSVDPSVALMSKKDYAILKKQTFLQFKKEYPYLKKSGLLAEVALYLLNLGPSTLAENGIKPGYMIIL